jgi:hypothetical protein
MSENLDLAICGAAVLVWEAIKAKNQMGYEKQNAWLNRSAFVSILLILRLVLIIIE